MNTKGINDTVRTSKEEADKAIVDKGLQDRYDKVHARILEGPNAGLQDMIDSGAAWHLEGSIGRAAMEGMREGLLVLSQGERWDYWGNHVPSFWQVRDEVGSPGSVANAEAALGEEG